MNLLIIGDPHANPDYDNDRFEALGKFIAKEKPQHVVCIGDMAAPILQWFPTLLW